MELMRDILIESAERFGEKAAFMQKEDGAYRAYSFLRYKSDVEAFGAGLLEMGLGGSRILLAGENCYAWVVAYMAVVSGVGFVVPVDKDATAEEIGTVARACGAGAIIGSDAVLSRVEGDVQKISFSQMGEILEAGRAAINGGASGVFDVEVDKDAEAVLLYEGGRGVMLSNANIVFDIEQTFGLLDVTDKDTFFSVLPLHYAFECTAGFLGALRAGATVAFGEGLGHIVANLAEVKPTVVLCVPLLMEALWRKVNVEIKRQGLEKKVQAAIRTTDAIRPKGLSVAAKRRVFASFHKMLGGHLRMLISVGSPADETVANGLASFGLRVIQGYGFAECAPFVAINPTRAPKSASVGVGLPEGTVDIYNVQKDGTGEIRYKGKNVMPGYCGDETTPAKRGEWFYTGDMGYLDQDGYLYVLGRKKNMMVTASGKSVYPEEIEALLCANPFVREAVVVGRIDASQKDYELVAVIHPDYDAVRQVYGQNFVPENVEGELDAALENVNEHVAPHKRLKAYIVRDNAFPKDTTRKIRRSSAAEDVKRGEEIV